jgi:hypothetical protein
MIYDDSSNSHLKITYMFEKIKGYGIAFVFD